ncbi:MAG: hypothetical protein LBE09_02295 [Christensenellaceae bacterium]|nr:hypothetical protein [Christensenellaceae bacterium]
MVRIKVVATVTTAEKVSGKPNYNHNKILAASGGIIIIRLLIIEKSEIGLEHNVP